MYSFDFEKPSTIDEAVAALSSEGAQALGGGQTLIPTLKQRLNAPDKLVSLTGIAEMKGVSQDGSTLKIGGGTTHGTIAKEARSSFPGLAGQASLIGDPAVRNRGTIGGSLANNDPAACYPSAALATGATIRTNNRSIAADDFFQGLFTTALEEGEIIVGVDFPIPQASNYQKFEQPASRFPLVGVFVAKYGDRVGVGVTGAGEDGAFRWAEAEEALSGTFSADALSGITHPADGLINDLHGTAAYRAHLIGVLTKRAVAAAN
ncbi:FAD binding domain-containing protein [Vannielia litorea]|uniref:Carbon-monoxide dehydrogenase medium subunit n=1 Tax=Vannielia litorea TaxID=1217970 RepID=A0A1N6H3Q9_9RHOB|nr:xanthine dehydrogenase family protein subunit M [Vannielia litorea]SIO14441.1 carbon-monoxide dehydrogenase medium subunit [Vannielia litorea]